MTNTMNGHAVLAKKIAAAEAKGLRRAAIYLIKRAALCHLSAERIFGAEAAGWCDAQAIKLENKT